MSNPRKLHWVAVKLFSITFKIIKTIILKSCEMDYHILQVFKKL